MLVGNRAGLRLAILALAQKGRPKPSFLDVGPSGLAAGRRTAALTLTVCRNRPRSEAPNGSPGPQQALRQLSVPELQNVIRRAAGTAIAPTLSSCDSVRD